MKERGKLTAAMLSKDKYPAYPNCLPIAAYLRTGSIPFASMAIAAALKCSTNLPNRKTLRAMPKFFFTDSKGAMVAAGLFVR